MQLKSQKRFRLFLIVLVYLIIMMIGIRYGIFQYISRERHLFHSLVLALLLTQICIVDGKIMGKPVSIFSRWLIFMLFGIAVPIYIIRARGLKGVIIVIAHYAALALVLIVSWLITTCLIYGTSILFV